MSAPLPSPSTSRQVGTPKGESESSLLLRQPSPRTEAQWRTKTSEESQGCSKIHHGSGQRAPRSFYLSPYFLIGLCLLFLSFAALLETLRYLSDRDQGFVSSDEGKHYLWTYGPTFVLSMVAAVWGQVEYRTLQSTPWLELRRQPLPAERNLLMNYISPWSLTALYRSLTAGHFAVTLSILGGVILKMLIIVSTSLLDLELKQLSQDTTLSVAMQFNLSRAHSDRPIKLGDPRAALWVVYQGETPGSRYPAGTTPEFAVLAPSLLTTPTGADIKLTANTSVFGVKQHECRTFSWTFNTPAKLPVGRNGILRADNLTLAEITKSPEELELLSQYCLVGRRYLTVPSEQPPMLTSRLQNSILNKTELVDTTCLRGVNGSLTYDQARIFLNVVVNLPGNVSHMAAALCHPTYQVTKRAVTISPTGDVFSISSEIIEVLEHDDLQPSLMTKHILSAGGDTVGGNTVSGSLVPENTWIDMMNLTNPQPDWRDFANPEILATAFRRAFQSVAVLTVGILKTDRMQSVQEVPGRVDFGASRLVVTPLSLRIMEGLLILATLVASALCFLHWGSKHEPAPSLMGTALILARSGRLDKTLSPNAQYQAPRPETLAARLRGILFYSILSPTRTQTVRIEVQDDAPIPASGSPSVEHGALKWWLPMAAARMYVVALVMSTIIAVVLLETLYQVSQRNGGLAEVSTTDNTRFVWLFLPTIIAAGIGLAYVAMDKATQILHPYLELSRGRGTQDTLQFEPRSSMALFALVQSLRRRFFGLSAMIMTSIVGGVLAIAASGLYTAVPFFEVRDIAADPKSWFALRGDGRMTPSRVFGVYEETAIAESLHFNNLSYPAGVWGGYAFAMPDLQSFASYYNTSGPPAKFAARVPAARMQLNCSLHEFHDTFDDHDPGGPSIQIAPPEGCTNGPDGVPIAGAKLHLSSPEFRTGYVGYLAPAGWAYFPKPGPFKYNSIEGNDFADIATPRPLCLNNVRHFFLLYGHRIGTVTTNLTVVRCTPYTEALDIDVTFHLPNMTVDDSISPPVPASPVTTLWSVTNSSNNSMERITFTTSRGNTDLDGVFHAITQGVDGIPMAEFADPRNMNRSIRRIETVLGNLAAEFIHLAFREPFNGTVDEGIPMPGRITGAVRVPLPEGRARLVQRGLSTRLLEGLLASLVVCSCVSWWLVGVGRGEVLPVDPGSVAARMSLLAGSDLVERLRRDGEHALDGEKLRMGWWEKDDGKRYGIDIVSRQR